MDRTYSDLLYRPVLVILNPQREQHFDSKYKNQPVLAHRTRVLDILKVVSTDRNNPYIKPVLGHILSVLPVGKQRLRMLNQTSHLQNKIDDCRNSHLTRLQILCKIEPDTR